MKNQYAFTLCAAALASLGILLAQADEAAPPSRFTGIWKWTFTMPDGGEVRPRLKVKEEGGKFTGVSSFRAGTETAVTNFQAKGDNMQFEVVRERDGKQIVTKYSGTISSNELKGEITSNWDGESHTYPWKAKKVLGLDGTWKWTIEGRNPYESTAILKQEGEKVTGRLPGRGRFPDIEVKEGKIKNNHVSFHTQIEFAGEKNIRKFHGKLEGDKIIGKTEGGFGGNTRTNDWVATRID
ncbi:MAG TPA: hypothetical protein VMZ27_10720 [Candidatus Saccharimonadales bacterium]|nr:hypothetical protein [Candidatus Saccharimonadales bacterium]